MSAAADEQGFNSTAATSDYISFPWMPADNIQDLGELGVIWGPPDPPPEKPKRKSKWLLKQMKRRGHR